MTFGSKHILRKKWPLFALILALLSPTVWSASRQGERLAVPNDDERVYLLHADRLMYDQFTNPDAQRLAGNVRFRHKGMTLSCDSAVYYQAGNSFEAFGHVHLIQGDTLSLDGERLRYSGNELLAEVRRNVVLKHRNQTLYTDSLNYDRLENLAYFFDGGKLIDGKDILTSDWGEYYTNTRLADFYYNVKLFNSKDSLLTDTLHYNTVTKWAEVKGPSNIYSGDSRIYTENGVYNSQTGKAKLFDRSQIFNKGKALVGDSVFYNKENGEMTALNNVVYRDTISGQDFLGDYVYYNEQTGEALAYDRALAKEYKNGPDTLFVHADTIRLHTFNIDTDSVYRRLHGYKHVRTYRRDMQAVADSMTFTTQGNLLQLYRDPIVWSDDRQIVGEEIRVWTNDSTLDSVHVMRQAMLVERLDSVHYNQVAGNLIRAYFYRGEMTLGCVDGNVCVVNFPLEKDSSIIYQNYLETAHLRMTMQNRKLKRMWAPASKGCFYVAGLAPEERTRLSGFAWFDYIRPLHAYDLFEWRPKKKGAELRPSVRHEAPLQTLPAH